MSSNSNGHGPSEYTEFTFPDSGKTILIRRVSPLLIAEVQKQFPEPSPPTVDVAYGEKVVSEPNAAHPDHVAAMAKHRRELGERIIRLIVKRGVQCTVEDDRVAELRADMQAEGITLPDDDKYVYVAHLLCESLADLNALRDAVLNRSMPTEGATAEAVNRFPAKVPGG